MSACPSWTSLVAHRFDPRAAEPAGWNDALAHLEGCDACRDEAIAADPTLALMRRPAVRVEPSEISDMRAAVAALRRAGRVTGEATPEPARARSLGSWPAVRRIAAALALAAGLLAATGSSGPELSPAAAVANLPVVEDLDRPGADVYHLEGDDLAVVMIVDTGLDV